MERRQAFPFPEIPVGTFPEESLGNEITLENSTLFDQSIIESAEIIKQYRDSQNSSERKSAMNRAISFCDSNYPQSYLFVQRILENQLEHDAHKSHESPSYNGYEVLEQALKKEFQPPENVKMFFQFQPHVIRSLKQEQEVKDLLGERLRNIFSKDGDNIFFLEMSNNSNEIRNGFENASNTYTSFTDLRLYLDYFAYFGKEPSFPVSKLRHLIKSTRDENAKYGYLVTSILDELHEEGYPIRMVVEDPTPVKVDINYYKIPRNAALEDLKAAYRKRCEQEALRDKVVINQLKELVKEAQVTQEQTNIFLLRGSAHAPMMDMLPKKMKIVSDFDNQGVYAREGELGEFDRKNYQMLIKLRSHQDISEREWEELYNS